MSKLLTTDEVADRLRTTPETVRYWRHIGYGPAGVKVGRRVLYEAAEIDRWLAHLATAEEPHRRDGGDDR